MGIVAFLPSSKKLVRAVRIERTLEQGLKLSPLPGWATLGWWVGVESNHSPKERLYRPLARAAGFAFPLVAPLGKSYPPCVMDFDHLPGAVKSFGLGSAKAKGTAAILAEIDKCEVVCANCHRLRTWVRRQA